MGPTLVTTSEKCLSLRKKSKLQTTMKKILFILTIMLNIPLLMTAQTYASLWKEVTDAEENDLPKSEQAALRKIVAKAEAEGNYDWLLRAELQEARALCSVSPDSLESAVERLKKREQEAKDDVLRAVYDAVLLGIRQGAPLFLFYVLLVQIYESLLFVLP